MSTNDDPNCPECGHFVRLHAYHSGCGVGGCLCMHGTKKPDAPWVYDPGPKEYTVRWSNEDQQWVATCEAHPSLSWLDDNPQAALHGLISVMESEGLDV